MKPAQWPCALGVGNSAPEVGEPMEPFFHSSMGSVKPDPIKEPLSFCFTHFKLFNWISILVGLTRYNNTWYLVTWGPSCFRTLLTIAREEIVRAEWCHHPVNRISNSQELWSSSHLLCHLKRTFKMALRRWKQIFGMQKGVNDHSYLICAGISRICLLTFFSRLVVRWRSRPVGHKSDFWFTLHRS